MAHSIIKRLSQFMMILVLLSGSFLTGTGAVAAQGVTCEPATPAAASADASATPTASDPVAFPAEGGELTVFAAASLTDAFAQITDDIQAANPDITISVQTGASQALVTQLEEGASADVLATANRSTMADAESKGLIVSPSTEFIANRLVIVTPADNPSGISGIESLTEPDTALVLAAADVPAGRYARTAICAWAAAQDDPDVAVAAISDNVVSEETDVRGVLAKVQTGEADAGIVYASDATASDLAGTPLYVVELPADVPTTAAYAIAPVTDGEADLANAFISYVMSPEGQDVLIEYGFTANS